MINNHNRIYAAAALLAAVCGVSTSTVSIVSRPHPNIIASWSPVETSSDVWRGNGKRRSKKMK